MSEEDASPTKQDKNFYRIADLRPKLKPVNCTFIVLDKVGETITKGSHKITHCIVADDSGRINLSLWGEQGEVLASGDIIRLIGGYCTLYKNSLVLYSGCMHGLIERIGQYCMLFREEPNMSAVKWDTENSKPAPRP